MSSFSVYPYQIDGYATLPLRRDLVHEIRADDVNRLRDAIVKIEQELGIQPSGVFATVAARLDSVGNAEALINSHILNTIDAHDASAISILDTSNNYISTEVEGALGELASILPASFDTIGNDNTEIPNDGIPSFVGGTGTLHVFTTSGGADIVKKTQPVSVTGITIIDVGENNGTGVGYLQYINPAGTLQWKAPGDSFGTAVDVSSLSAGEITTLESSTTTKRIRVARNSDSLPSTVGTFSDTFDLIKFDAVSGTFSIDGVGFKNSSNITRTATSSTALAVNCRKQFMISGMVFPADKGTLVLQRKLRLDSDEFSPVATLDLGSNFSESLRDTGQPVYTPSLTTYDTITLFDRHPARNDYDELSTDADGNSIYENFNLEATYGPFQVAKYLIPVSNSLIVNGELLAPADTSLTEINNSVCAYRLVHYKEDVSDFNGEPASTDIFSLSDPLAGADDGDNNIRISNVYIDTNPNRPTISMLTLSPIVDAELVTKTISGIHYYNSSTDLFNIELKSESNIFSNSYLYDNILRFTTDVFDFPTGDGYGLNVDIDKLSFINSPTDAYEYYSAENLPSFSEEAFYIVNSTYLDGYRPSIGSSQYSNNAYVSAALYDPFGAGATFTAHNVTDDVGIRILVNSFSTSRSTDTQEWFTDESYRVDTPETFDFALDDGQFTGAGTNGTLDAFDGSIPLVDGELQCGGLFSNQNSPGLVYPQENYEDPIRPLQQASTDYSAFSSDCIYQRLFNIGVSTNGGRLRIQSSGDYPVSFDDIDANNSSRPIKISVKIPGVGSNSTGFLDIGKLFVTEEFDDGDGALAGTVTGGAGSFEVPFIFGTRNNADTNNMIAVRITYLSSALADAKTRIISMIELLP